VGLAPDKWGIVMGIRASGDKAKDNLKYIEIVVFSYKLLFMS
jgi:hypothetical protein